MMGSKELSIFINSVEILLFTQFLHLSGIHQSGPRCERKKRTTRIPPTQTMTVARMRSLGAKTCQAIVSKFFNKIIGRQTAQSSWKTVINMCFCSNSINCAHLCPKIKFTPHEGIGPGDVTLATGLTKCENI